MKFFKTVVVIGALLASSLVDAANLACGNDGTIEVTMTAAEAMNFEIVAGNSVAIRTARPENADVAAIHADCKLDAYVSGDISMTFTQEKCDPVHSEVGDNVVYTWRMWKVPKAADFNTVARFANAFMEFECQYPKIVEVSATFEPTISAIHFSTSATGELTFSMALYSDSSDTAFVNPVVVPARVYGVITLGVTNMGTMTAMVKKCWATGSADATDTAHGTYEFVDNFCGQRGNANDPASVAIVTEAGTTLTAKYNFESFVFADEFEAYSTVFIHCEAYACDSSAESCAKETLPCTTATKKKREVEDDRRLAANTRIVSSGPLHIYPAPKTCDQNNGDCAEICTMEENKALCSCAGDRVLAANKKSCIIRVLAVADEVPEIHSQTEDFLYLDATTVFVVVALLLATLLIAALVFRRCSRSEFQKPRVFQSA
uniref:Alpha-tectorin n=1 Tax=Phallusia mammillata TaxID=59560 RepID=A0A6F9DUN5_9ASCI|nr:alpha-tectorin [Phallusia mammillata]